MLVILKTQETGATERIDRIVQRDEDQRFVEPAVRAILEQVREQGDAALCALTERFDHVTLRPAELRVREEEFEEAVDAIHPEALGSLARMKERITAFHRNECRASWMMEQKDGSSMGQLIRPLETVGFYVPGGEAPYPSTVLMNVVPAQLAGVRRCIIATPPQKDGRINPYVLAAARLCNIDTVYRVGGAQAIAALAYGTSTIPRVDKIVGPGNIYVDTAKRLVFGAVDIDAPAGPSEVAILADASANPVWVAADLLSQAEHDTQATAVLITPSLKLAESVREALERQIGRHPRSSVMKEALANHGAAIVTNSIDEAVTLVNRIAPEHLEIVVNDPTALLSAIRHAGMILVGDHAPVPLCDYGAGPNHVLPTGGKARFASPLGVGDFVKRSNLLIARESLLAEIADDVCRIAEIEGFTAHANAVDLRRCHNDVR